MKELGHLVDTRHIYRSDTYTPVSGSFNTLIGNCVCDQTSTQDGQYLELLHVGANLDHSHTFINS